MGRKGARKMKQVCIEKRVPLKNGTVLECSDMGKVKGREVWMSINCLLREDTESLSKLWHSGILDTAQSYYFI